MRWRLALLVTLIIGLAVTAALLPLHRIPDAIAGLGWWAPVVGALVGTALLAALIPRTAISIACGATFGALGGGFVALAAAMLAAAVTFAIGRALGRDAVAARAGDRWARLDAWLSRRGLLAVTVVRMIPIAPYGLVGYAYGTTSVRRWHYAIGTLIGATPSAFTYAAVGAAAVQPGAIRLVTLLPAAIG
ncbi:MAG TPA: VTT domain-containing protein, partial [Micromonosporaceae bacterium]